MRGPRNRSSSLCYTSQRHLDPNRNKRNKRNIHKTMTDQVVHANYLRLSLGWPPLAIITERRKLFKQRLIHSR